MPAGRRNTATKKRPRHKKGRDGNDKEGDNDEEDESSSSSSSSLPPPPPQPPLQQHQQQHQQQQHQQKEQEIYGGLDLTDTPRNLPLLPSSNEAFSSPYKGVTRDSKGIGWQARLCVGNSFIYLGNFPTPKQAAEIYVRARYLVKNKNGNNNTKNKQQPSSSASSAVANKKASRKNKRIDKRHAAVVPTDKKGQNHQPYTTTKRPRLVTPQHKKAARTSQASKDAPQTSLSTRVAKTKTSKTKLRPVKKTDASITKTTKHQKQSTRQRVFCQQSRYPKKTTNTKKITNRAATTQQERSKSVRDNTHSPMLLLPPPPSPPKDSCSQEEGNSSADEEPLFTGHDRQQQTSTATSTTTTKTTTTTASTTSHKRQGQQQGQQQVQQQQRRRQRRQLDDEHQKDFYGGFDLRHVPRHLPLIPAKSGESRFRGVRQVGLHRWRASIVVQGRFKHLGTFATEHQAALVHARVAYYLGHFYKSDMAPSSSSSSCPPVAMTREARPDGTMDAEEGCSALLQWPDLTHAIQQRLQKPCLYWHYQRRYYPSGECRRTVWRVLGSSSTSGM